MNKINSFKLNAKQFVTDFFTKGHPRSIEAKKNIAASFVIKGISIIINLALVPLTIHYVNPTQYGIWLTLSSIVAWFSFFDIGFGQGLRNKFAEAKALGELEKARIYVSNTYAILSIVFTSVWILFFIVNHFVDWSAILNTTKDMASELSTVALIVFSFFCLQFILKIINIVLIADQKPAKSAFFDMLGQLIALIIIFVLTKVTKGSLVYLSLALGFAPIVVMLFSSLWFYNTKYKFFAPSLKHVNFSYAKDIMGLGVKFFIIQFSAIFVFQATNLIIIQILDAEQVTIYNIGYKYFFIVHTLTGIIVAPFWSAFTEAYSKNDFKWMKNVVKTLNKIWYLILLLVVFMFFISNTVYKLWIGDVVTIPVSISFLLALNVLVSSRFAIFIAIINGIGKIKLQLYSNVILAILYIPFTIYLGKQLGLNGIIISNIIISTVFAILAPIQVNMILDKKANGVFDK